MASVAPALDLVSAPAEDASSSKDICEHNGSESIAQSGSDQPVAPDQFDPKWETSKWEIWSYYAYYEGQPNNN